LRAVEGTCEVRYTRYYDASLDQVWAALTERDSLARWLGPTHELTLHHGGRFELELEGGTVTGRVRAVESSRLLELDWVEGGERRSIVRFELSSDGSGTVLVLDHRRIDAAIGMRYLTRWGSRLARLDRVVEP
jgi:uncharacterized protein YndB with AHSA1/START domain